MGMRGVGRVRGINGGGGEEISEGKEEEGGA